MIFSDEISIETNPGVEIIDITHEVELKINKSKLKNGVITLFVPGSTGALTTIEYEPGLLKDLPDALQRLAPDNISYNHNFQWHDGNGHSHVRASIIGPSLSIPIINGKLPLGRWQQIVFLELDVRKRNRKIIVQIYGE